MGKRGRHAKKYAAMAAGQQQRIADKIAGRAPARRRASCHLPAGVSSRRDGKRQAGIEWSPSASAAFPRRAGRWVVARRTGVGACGGQRNFTCPPRYRSPPCPANRTSVLRARIPPQVGIRRVETSAQAEDSVPQTARADACREVLARRAATALSSRAGTRHGATNRVQCRAAASAAAGLFHNSLRLDTASSTAQRRSPCSNQQRSSMSEARNRKPRLQRPDKSEDMSGARSCAPRQQRRAAPVATVQHAGCRSSQPPRRSSYRRDRQEKC